MFSSSTGWRPTYPRQGAFETCGYPGLTSNSFTSFLLLTGGRPIPGAVLFWPGVPRPRGVGPKPAGPFRAIQHSGLVFASTTRHQRGPKFETIHHAGTATEPAIDRRLRSHVGESDVLAQLVDVIAPVAEACRCPRVTIQVVPGRLITPFNGEAHVADIGPFVGEHDAEC